jgi:hypothetical protein
MRRCSAQQQQQQLSRSPSRSTFACVPSEARLGADETNGRPEGTATVRLCLKKTAGLMGSKRRGRGRRYEPSRPQASTARRFADADQPNRLSAGLPLLLSSSLSRSCSCAQQSSHHHSRAFAVPESRSPMAPPANQPPPRACGLINASSKWHTAAALLQKPQYRACSCPCLDRCHGCRESVPSSDLA